MVQGISSRACTLSGATIGDSPIVAPLLFHGGVTCPRNCAVESRSPWLGSWLGAGARAQQPKAFANAAAVEDGARPQGQRRSLTACSSSAFPRGDMSVTVRGVAVKPGFALGSWVAFADMARGGAMVMGDLVLAESEVEPVMRALQSGGVEQTALHNHVLGEIASRDVHAHSRARRSRRRSRTRSTPRWRSRRRRSGLPAAPVAAPVELDTAGVAAALGVTGKMNGPVYQVAVPRAEPITDAGQPVPASMGIATAINFQPTGGGKAAITGDFVLRASEVNPVLRELRQHGIEVTAIHSHMIDEEPRLLFMHFWANDNAVTLARGLEAALDRTNSRR